MGKVVLLQLLVPERQVLVVEEVMCHVVADVAEKPAAKDGRGHAPVPEEQRVCQFPERNCEGDEEYGRHDEAILVHRQVVVDAVEQEVGCDADPVVWQVPNKG